MTVSAEARIRARLRALRAALETDIGPSDGAGLTPPGPTRLGAMQHQTQSAGEIAQRLAAIKRIDEAMARIDANKYGYCASCGTKIEDARLESDPATILCAKCGGDQQ